MLWFLSSGTPTFLWQHFSFNMSIVEWCSSLLCSKVGGREYEKGLRRTHFYMSIFGIKSILIWTKVKANIKVHESSPCKLSSLCDSCYTHFEVRTVLMSNTVSSVAVLFLCLIKSTNIDLCVLNLLVIEKTTTVICNSLFKPFFYLLFYNIPLVNV